MDGVRLEDVGLVAVVDKRRGELVGLSLRLSFDLELLGQGLGDVVGCHGGDIAGLIGPALPACDRCGPGFLWFLQFRHGIPFLPPGRALRERKPGGGILDLKRHFVTIT